MRKSKRQVLVTIHGIRTFGQWQNRLGSLVRTTKTEFTVENYGYGYFSVLAFLIPIFRWLAVRKFRNGLLHLMDKHKDAEFSFVAHSFGTHLLAWALAGMPRDKDPTIKLIVLAGSVLKSTFDWNELLKRLRIGRVVNDCGVKDNVLLLSQLFVLFTGMAGRVGFYGFSNEKILNRYYAGGHSDYFESARSDQDAFMREQWLPIIANDAVPIPHDCRVSGGSIHGIGLFVMQLADPIKLAIYGSAFVALAYFGYVLPRQETLQQMLKAEASEARNLLKNGNELAALQKAIFVLESDSPSAMEGFDLAYNMVFNRSGHVTKEVAFGSTSFGYSTWKVIGDRFFVLSSTGQAVLLSKFGEVEYREELREFGYNPELAGDGRTLFYKKIGSGDLIAFDIESRLAKSFSTFALDADRKAHSVRAKTVLGLQRKTTDQV